MLKKIKEIDETCFAIYIFHQFCIIYKIIFAKNRNLKLGHIAFAENTSTKHYKTGLIYVPKSISDKQKQSLESFRKQLEKEDYNITELTNLFRADDGILMGNQRIGKADILKHITETELER